VGFWQGGRVSLWQECARPDTISTENVLLYTGSRDIPRSDTHEVFLGEEAKET
jgi:hypothetical protein